MKKQFWTISCGVLVWAAVALSVAEEYRTYLKGDGEESLQDKIRRFKEADAAPEADSLWLKAEKEGKVRIYEEKKPKLHDLVTVLVIEESSADKGAKTNLKRDSKMEMDIDEFVNIKGHGFIRNKLAPTAANKPSIDVEAKKSFDGKGSTGRKDSVKARITAEIVQVMPNGNFVVEAKKDIKVNDEDQTLTLTGVIRPEDILADNTIVSTRVADLRIRYEGKGALGTTQRRGWLHRFVDFVWPF